MEELLKHGGYTGVINNAGDVKELLEWILKSSIWAAQIVQKVSYDTM